MSPIFTAIAILILTPIAIAACSLAPWVPTKRKDFKRINDQLKIKDGSTFYELGCGEGRVCRYIAKKNPNATIIGIEKALPIYLIAHIRQLLMPHKNLQYIYGDVLKADLSGADALYTYAMIQTINEKLKPKFLKELKPGCRIVSYQFAMTDWPGEQEVDQPQKEDPRLYVYER